MIFFMSPNWPTCRSICVSVNFYYWFIKRRSNVYWKTINTNMHQCIFNYISGLLYIKGGNEFCSVFYSWLFARTYLNKINFWSLLFYQDDNFFPIIVFFRLNFIVIVDSDIIIIKYWKEVRF